MKYIALSFLFFYTAFLNAQTAQNITHEVKSDRVIIRYQLPDFNDRFVFDVSIWCSLDDGQQFLLKNVEGQVGPNIRAERTTYEAVWKFKKQVKEVINPQFIIVLDLVKMDPTNRPSTIKEEIRENFGDVRNWYVGYNGSFGFENQSLGWRIANFGKLGGYLAFSVDPSNTTVGSFTGGVTARLTQTNPYQIHYYFGTGVGDFFDEITFETGIIQTFGFFSLALGMNFETGVDETNFVFGCGIKFK